MLNIIVRGFTRGGETSSARQWYALQILNIEDLPADLEEGETKAPVVEINFHKKMQQMSIPIMTTPWSSPWGVMTRILKESW